MTTYPPPWIDPATGEDDEETLFAMTRAKEEQPQIPAQATGGTAPYPVIACDDCINLGWCGGDRCWVHTCDLAGGRRDFKLDDNKPHPGWSPKWCPLKKNEDQSR